MDGYVIIDSAHDGVTNMAIDQALLELGDRSVTAFLRLYRWSEPTLSLGYFQDLSERNSHAGSQSLSVVRRATGGGAIIHDQEWTYALVLPLAESQLGASQSLYRDVHDQVAVFLRQYGIDASRYEPVAASQADRIPRVEPQLSLTENQRAFLCFQRRTSGDLVSGGHKLLGSAQRRFGRTVLQHGSLLVGQSAFAPELVGLEEVARQNQAKSSKNSPISTQVEVAQLAEFICHACPDGVRWQSGHLEKHLPASEVEKHRLKFGSNDWLRRIR